MNLFRRPIIVSSMLEALLWPFCGLFSVTGLFLHKDRSLSILYPALMGREREEVTRTMHM